MKQKHILTLCIFLFALKANAQQLIAAIDSVYANPYDGTTKYLTLVIHNTDNKPVLINKAQLLKRHNSPYDEMSSGRDAILISNYDSLAMTMGDMRLVNIEKRIFLYDSLFKIFRSYDSVTMAKNNYLPVVKKENKEYFEIAANGAMQFIICWEVYDVDRVDFKLLKLNEWGKIKLSLKILVYCYTKNGDREMELFIPNADKFKQTIRH